MRRFAGACLVVFSRVLAPQNVNHKVGNKNTSYTKLASWPLNGSCS